jgi:CheY-like chemotaxis protein
VIVVADDLIWASRLSAAVKNAGASAVVAKALAETESHDAPVIVDLNGRGYDGVEAVSQAARGGHRVLAVGQHEDLELRKRALAAGAVRVLSYNKMFTDGPNVVAALIEGKL